MSLSGHQYDKCEYEITEFNLILDWYSQGNTLFTPATTIAAKKSYKYQQKIAWVKSPPDICLEKMLQIKKDFCPLL